MPRKPQPPPPQPDEPDKPQPDEPEGHLRFIAEGEEWPHGDLAEGAPEEARLAQGIARGLLDCLDECDTNVNAVATSTRLSTQALYNLRDGKSSPSLVTVARLETHFNRRLWGHEHMPEHPQRKAPRDYIAEGEQWPEGRLADTAPKEAHLAQGIAKQVLKQIDRNDTTIKKVAATQQLRIKTLQDLIDGKAWPDFVTVARLEIHFDRRLWGHEHKPKHRKPRPGAS